MTTEPIDPDVDADTQRAEISKTHGLVLLAISIGGGIGALARWCLSELVPNNSFPWATFLANVTGSFLIGVLLVLVTYRFAEQKYLRPFLGVGFLGGFTTFSTYSEQTVSLLNDGAFGLAFAYVFGTLATALIAVLLGTRLARAVFAGATR